MADEDFMDDDGDTGDGDEGIFGDSGDVLNREPESSRNPQQTRAQEDQNEQMPGTPPPEPRRDLVFARDAYGNLMVAWSVNGNLVEAFRAPTPQELQMAPAARWRAVGPQATAPNAMPNAMPGAMPGMMPGAMPGMIPGMGVPTAMGMAGLGQAGNAPPSGGKDSQPSGSGFGGLLKNIIVIAAVGAAGWYAYQWYNKRQAGGSNPPSSEDATEAEMAEAEDVEQETEV